MRQSLQIVFDMRCICYSRQEDQSGFHRNNTNDFPSCILLHWVYLNVFFDACQHLSKDKSRIFSFRAWPFFFHILYKYQRLSVLCKGNSVAFWSFHCSGFSVFHSKFFCFHSFWPCIPGMSALRLALYFSHTLYRGDFPYKILCSHCDTLAPSLNIRNSNAPLYLKVFHI